MKPFLLLLLTLCLAVSLPAQTPVDRLVRTLDSLSSVSFDSWKMSPDLKVARIDGLAPTAPGFDDSKWETLSLKKSVYPDSCWLRKEIVLPDRILGSPVGGKMQLKVTLDDYGSLWVNGESRGKFLWEGSFVLSENAKPGDRFLVAIRAVNTGGPMRLLRAELDMESIHETQKIFRDFAVSLSVGQRLLSFDTYQVNAYSGQKEDPGIDKSTIARAERTELNTLLQRLASSIDYSAVQRGDAASIRAALEAMRPGLAPVAAFAKRFTLTLTSNAHIDAAWLWREGETKIVAKNTFNAVLNMMDARPDFTYSQSAAQYYQWMQDSYPDILKRIAGRVKDKRWEITGGMWIEPDCNLISGESWMRQFLFAQQYFKKTFGFMPRLGWNPDSFGYTWNMPQFFQQSGIDAFITQKISWNDTNVFPYRVFWWESPDQSRVLVYFPFSYVNELDDAFELVDWQRQFEANTSLRHMMVLFGVGDHGGGPTQEMLDRVDYFRSLDVYPTVRFATAQTYVDFLREQDPALFPVWNDELYLEYHRGTFTTQAKVKEANRRSEVQLTTAEKLASIAARFGAPYPDLRKAWENVLFNQFHDILPGSSIREVYIDAAERYAAAHQSGRIALQNALSSLSSKIATTSITRGTPLVVFNPLSWERSDVVSLELPEGDMQQYSVLDGRREVRSQIVETGPYNRTLLFEAKGVPPLGYRTFTLLTGESKARPAPLSVTPSSLENDYFKITLDPDSGWIRSIVDKRFGKEVLSGYGNQLQLLEDKPKAWDAWNVGWTGTLYPTTLRSVEIGERGPLRVSLRVTRDVLGPSFKRDYPAEGYPSSFFTQEILLTAGKELVEFKTDVDWWEERTMLKVAFPMAAYDTMATYEIPYGWIRRSTQSVTSYDRAKKEVPALRWADLAGAGYGVSLLNASKYGYDIKGNVMRLSLLRSPKWPDPTADRGKHEIHYALYPHTGSWQDANTVQRGIEYNSPLLVTTTTRHAGSLPLSSSFGSLTPANLILTTIKKSEAGETWTYQFYEAEGTDARAELELPAVPRKVVRSNFLEEEGTAVPFQGKRVSLDVKRNSVVTLLITY